jgi:hypothetical protein
MLISTLGSLQGISVDQIICGCVAKTSLLTITRGLKTAPPRPPTVKIESQRRCAKHLNGAMAGTMSARGSCQGSTFLPPVRSGSVGLSI